MTTTHYDPYPPAVTTQRAEPVPAPPPPRAVPFRFTGTAGEYFRIWIVNVALSILTLGIYSAWAKVRTKQYFYGNTWLEDSTFQYLANPIPILKGRLIVAAVLGLLFFAQTYSLELYVTLVLFVILCTPFVVVKSLAFNARNSAFRNVRFSFTGNAGEATGVYLLMVLLQLVTCGIGYPYTQWRLTSFVLSRHLFGDFRFDWGTRSGEYFRVFLMATLLSLPVLGVVVAVIALTAYSGEPPSTLTGAVFVVAYAGMLIPASYIKAGIANATYGGLVIGRHRLTSTQRARDLVKLYATNLLGVVLSLGLLIPWAKVRLARYRAEHLTLIAQGPLLAENYELGGKASALGDAAMDLGDYDLDLGL